MPFFFSINAKLKDGPTAVLLSLFVLTLNPKQEHKLQVCQLPICHVYIGEKCIFS